MDLDALTIPQGTWLWPAVAVLAVALALLVWSYRPAPRGALAWGCAALKFFGFGALAFCLLEPLWVGQRVRPGANLFAVVADNSQSLQIKDRDAARSRGADVRELVADAAGNWQQALAAAFDVRRYYFDTRLQTTTDFRELDFSGRASALGAALRGLAERVQGRSAAGVLLFTDGNATDLPAGLPKLEGLPPIYPVVAGRGGPARDVAVQRVQVGQTAFEDGPVTVQADVAAAGLRGEPVSVRVVDAGGRTVQTQTLPGGPEEVPLAFRFQFKPDKPGLSFYQLRAAAGRESDGTAPAPEANEATLANNQHVFVVDRGHGPYRILYVAGRPNWEFKFLNRAVQEDEQVQLVGLIRVAKREPKFEFRGRAGETSNPLYRGFGDQSPEEVQRYDQPVLVRLNTRDERELRSGFPRTPEELFGYHAVILDDVEAEFFTAEQKALLQRFVAERGGGFLMLGGMESFREGNYARTPVGDLLPVYLDRAPEPTKAAAGHFQLAREGWLQAWARLREHESDERARLDAMPAFQVLNRVREVKPGASIVATVREDGGAESPALVVQRFGRGRSAALTVGDLWRWGMQDADKRRDLDKAWRQLLRWLVTDVPGRVDCTVEPLPVDANGAVRLQVRVRDAKFQPVDDAKVSLEIEPVLTVGAAPSGAGKLRLTAEPAAEPGLFEATYVPRLTGGFRTAAVATDAAGAEIGRAEAGWSTDLAAAEFRALTPNTALLGELARRTGGEVVAADRLPQFVRDLPNRRAPVMEAWSSPAWHTPVVFACALLCLVSEWGLRRWKGLP